MATKTLKQILDALIDKLTPLLRDAFLFSIQDINDQVILKDLIAAIEAKDYARAFRVLGMSPGAMRPLTAALEQIFEQGGVAVARTFPAVVNTDYGRGAFHFDVRNLQAEKWLREQSSSLVTRIQEDTRVNVMNILQRNLEAGNNPRTTALDIVGRLGADGKRQGGIVGLDQRQELWVTNARRDLTNLDANYFKRLRRDKRFDSIVRKAIADGKPLDKDTIDRLISRYKDSLLQLRGENIGRTETIQALNRSQHEAIRQGVEAGAMSASAVQREWDTAGDTRVRHSHAEMDGQSVGLDEPFTTPRGEKLMFPGDTSLGASAGEVINCRCRVKMKIDFLADLD